METEKTLREILAEHAHKAAALLWAIDTNDSLERKARAGYRSNPKLGDAPFDPEPYADARREAEAAARTFLLECGLIKLASGVRVKPSGRDGHMVEIG